MEVNSISTRKHIGIMGIANLLNFILNFASVIFVSRFLTPEEIGIYSVSVAFVSFAYVIRDFGVDQYLVQAKHLDERVIRSIYAVSMLFSWSTGLLLIAASYPIASLYESEEMKLVILIVSFKFFLIPFSSPIVSMLRRELEFTKIAIINVLTTLVQTGSTVYFAYAGESYLSMAWAAVLAQIFQVVLVANVYKGKAFYFPSFKGAKDVFNFGFISMLTSFLGTLSNSAPDIILGRTLGFSSVAIFSRSVGLKKMIVERLLSLVRSVHFPTFAKEVRNGRDGGEMLLQATAYVLSLLIPVLTVLSITSEPLILFLFGEQWQAATYLATLICLFSILEAPYALLGFSLIAIGRVTERLKMVTVAIVLRISVLMTSFVYSLEQVVELLFISYLITFIFYHYIAHKNFGISFVSMLRILIPALLLIPLSAIGPIFFSFIWENSGSVDYLIALIGSAITATAGWLISVYLTNNIYKKEVNLLVQNVQRLISANKSKSSV